MFESSGRTELGQSVDDFDAPDLTPEEVTEHYAGVVANILEGTNLIEVREIQANMVNQIHLLARVKEKDARTVAQLVVKSILFAVEASDVDAFIGKQYLIKEGDLVYAWVFSFTHPSNIKKVADVVSAAIDKAIPTKKVDVLEAPLLGSGPPQSTGVGIKGARPVR